MTSSAQNAAPEPALRLRRLLPGGPPVTVERFVDELELPEPAERTAARQAHGGGPGGHTKPSDAGEGAYASHRSRPYVLLNMIATADGRASLGGRSGALGGAADKQLFHGLRTVVDAVMAGAGTVRAERYNRLVRDERRRAIRRANGLAEEPLACVVSGRLALDADIPLLADPLARVAIITPSSASLPDSCRADISYVRAAHAGARTAAGTEPGAGTAAGTEPGAGTAAPALDLPRALGELRNRLGVRTLLCEGGAHLNAQLLAGGLVDELFLSLSPLLAGDDPDGATLRIVAGSTLDPPVSLELVGALEHDSNLFLHYRVNPPPDAPATAQRR